MTNANILTKHDGKVFSDKEFQEIEELIKTTQDKVGKFVFNKLDKTYQMEANTYFVASEIYNIIYGFNNDMEIEEEHDNEYRFTIFHNNKNTDLSDYIIFDYIMDSSFEYFIIKCSNEEQDYYDIYEFTDRSVDTLNNLMKYISDMMVRYN